MKPSSTAIGITKKPDDEALQSTGLAVRCFAGPSPRHLYGPPTGVSRGNDELMWYWGQSHFEGLKAIAEHYGSEATYPLFREYCALQESGLRREAFTSLAAFLSQAKAWPAERRTAFVDQLMGIHLANPTVHSLIPHPLLNGLVLPTLRQWVDDRPEDAAPHRWLGVLEQDPAELDWALQLDPADQVALVRRANAYIDGVDYDCHHLSEGIFLGDPEACMLDLDRAVALAGRITNASVRDGLKSECTYFSSLITDWRTYCRIQPPEPFPDWCASLGRAYTWCKAFYYEE